MPLNDFYTYKLINTGKNNLQAEITIDAEHAIYKGHFPEQPITPGVILVEMLRFILSENTGERLMLTSAKEIKFSSPVIPSVEKTINLNVDFEFINEGYKVSCQFTSGDKTFTKLKGVFSVG